MKRKLTLIAVLCAALAAGSASAAFSAEAHPAQDSKKQTQKEKADRDDDDEDEDDDEDDDESESAEKQAKLAKEAKITMERAREIALQRAPGTVEEAELEREKGRLVYSFDIRNDRGTITEVHVDANDGSVVSVEEEDARKEAGEKRQEAREKAGSKKRP